MDEKKPSTAEILAKIRAQKAGGAPTAAPAPADSTSARDSTSASSETAPAPVVSEAAAAPEVSPSESVPAAPVPAAPVADAPQAGAPTGAKPTGTKDILAAIRAQGAKGSTKPAAAAPTTAAATTSGTAAAAVTPAANKPAAKPDAPAQAGPLPSIAEMVRAARKGAPTVEAGKATAAAPVAAPPMPVKPPPAKSPGKPAGKVAAPSSIRRSMSAIVAVASASLACFVGAALLGSPVLFAAGLLIWGIVMTPFAAAWASLTAVAGVATLGTARFMFPNVLVEPPSKFKVGPSSDYPLNTVSNKWKDQFGIWIVHTDQYEGKNLIYALSTVCTHLGCTPNWLDGEQKFKCPCHGSGFYITGVNFEGPAPRPLERVGLRVAEDGLLEVDKSLKFQEEMGQWIDAASYVEVV